MTNTFKILVLLVSLTSCVQKEMVDTKTYFLSYINKLPDNSIKTSDSLTENQKKLMLKYNLGVYIPKDFKSIIDNEDQEAFIFYN